MTSTTERQTEQAIDGDRLMSFVFRAVDEVGATLNAALVVVGDELGYYRALADGGPLTAAELAVATGTDAHYAREWLNAQAAGSFVDYDPATARYTLPAEHAVALTDESSPAFLPGLFQIAVGTVAGAGRIPDAARAAPVSAGTSTTATCTTAASGSSGPGYHAHLVDEWLPAVGVADRLREGATVADVGCGHGASTVLMAEAFPASRFHGSDYHAESIEVARARAVEAGVAGSRHLRGGAGRRVRRGRLRPRHDVRRPPRHGRPAGRGAPRPRRAGRRRRLDGRRADGR